MDTVRKCTVSLKNLYTYVKSYVPFWYTFPVLRHFSRFETVHKDETAYKDVICNAKIGLRFAGDKNSTVKSGCSGHDHPSSDSKASPKKIIACRAFSFHRILPQHVIDGVKYLHLFYPCVCTRSNIYTALNPLFCNSLQFFAISNVTPFTATRYALFTHNPYHVLAQWLTHFCPFSAPRPREV